MSASPPWLDLPTELAEKIMEGLPLSDNVRFASVCRQWRAIQSDHRLRHAPSPPPMINLPWFVPLNRPEQEEVSCYSPFEGRFYRVRIPGLSQSEPFLGGWILREDAVVNPISGVEIPLPEGLRRSCTLHTAAFSPPPNSVVFVVSGRRDLFLFRQGDRQWTELRLPMDVTAAVAVAGKLYCLCPEEDRAGWSWVPKAHHLAVVDPATAPSVRLHEMTGWSQKLAGQAFGRDRLVESRGEVLLVREINRYRPLPCRKTGFQVFKPDINKRAWARVDCLGDTLLQIAHDEIHSVPAVAGLRRNCIYFSTGLTHRSPDDEDADAVDPWMAFDLGLGTAAAATFPNASRVQENYQRVLIPCMS